MSAEISRNAVQPKVTGRTSGSVLPLRVGKRSMAIRILTKVLKQAGFVPGTRFEVETRDDGSILLRPQSKAAGTASDSAVERCAAEVLATRRELLERLAK